MAQNSIRIHQNVTYTVAITDPVEVNVFSDGIRLLEIPSDKEAHAPETNGLRVDVDYRGIVFTAIRPVERDIRFELTEARDVEVFEDRWRIRALSGVRSVQIGPGGLLIDGVAEQRHAVEHRASVEERLQRAEAILQQSETKEQELKDITEQLDQLKASAENYGNPTSITILLDQAASLLCQAKAQLMVMVSDSERDLDAIKQAVSSGGVGGRK